MKRVLVKSAVAAGSMWRPLRSRDIVVLMYHGVTGQHRLEMNVEFENFRKQMRSLADIGKVVSLERALHLLRHQAVENGPYVVLTFDDGFRDFYTHAFPVLSDLGLPAVLYVPTGFVDDPSRLPMSKTVPLSDSVAPVNWNMLGELNDSPLITLGSHSHTHAELTTLEHESEVLAEIETALSRFDSELGIRPRHFAYPRGKWNPQVEAIIRPFHESMAVIGGRAIAASEYDPRRITRLSIGRSDSMRWFRAKLNGRLDGEETARAVLMDQMRRLSAQRQRSGLAAAAAAAAPSGCLTFPWEHIVG